MQSNRQRQIIQVLAEQGTMTAKELANCFSVSPRTIYRDIVALTAAGLPLSMTQGRDGGITLDPLLPSRTRSPGEKARDAAWRHHQ